jgi:hypothetical protein
MGSSYVRCFYRLENDDSVYQETPFGSLFIIWTQERQRNMSQHELPIWLYVRDHFDRTCDDYQTRYTRKVITHTSNDNHVE